MTNVIVAKELKGTCKVPVSAHDASLLADNLADMYQMCNEEITIVLQAEGSIFIGID